MLPRAVRRLETVFALSRQALPRPERLYTTPSHPSKSPSVATQEARIPYPAFLNAKHPPTRPVNEERILTDLEKFLARDKTYTVLPSPSPPGTSNDNSWFTDTMTQESMSIMETCLHNSLDVPRAKTIFGQLRKRETSSLLEVGVYNAFIEAYFGMATQKEPENQDQWLGEIYDLYELLESGAENVAPDQVTYGLMLQIWMHYNQESQNPVEMPVPSTQVKLPTASELLFKMHERKISPALVVAETVFDNHKSATQAIKTLSQAALIMNFPDMITELGQAQVSVLSEDALEGVPQVKPVTREAKYDARGNLVYGPDVPFNISQLRRHLENMNETRRILADDSLVRQRQLERSAYEVALERLQQQTEKRDSIGVMNPALKDSSLQTWMWTWHQKLRNRIEQEIDRIIQGQKMNLPRETDKDLLKIRENKNRSQLKAFLLLMKPERLSLITILEIMRLQGSGGLTDGMKTTRAVVSVGKAVEAEYRAQAGKRHQASKDRLSAGVSEKWAQDEMLLGLLSAAAPSMDYSIYSEVLYNTMRERRMAAARRLKGVDGWDSGWPQVIRAQIGGILVDCLMEVAEVERTAIDKKTGETVSEMQPAFYHTFEYQRGYRIGVVRLNPVVSERMARDHLKDTLHPRQLPMLVEPEPWTSHNRGGYMYSRTPVMRYKDSQEQRIYIKQASENGQFEYVYTGLDVLGSTPWKINREIFNVVVQVWNSGERVGKVPPAVYDRPEPELPPNFGTDMKEKSVYMQRQKAYNQAKANNHSERCSVNYKLEIARAFLNETFYFPHNLDFRGRAYPIPAHLNHIGDDLCRGLLTFGEAKALGEKGLRWLKIHIANLYGFDKAAFDERVKWVDDHMDQIREAATNPLDGSRWWLSAGDPWQFLAASMELCAAYESEDPHTYESSLPVHQDGTCNGLQHYAALGGDVQGAQQVNLVAGDKPSDVYSHVGRMVEEVIEKDALKGEKYAMMLQGKITRKVVKQTVMTTVYGVTYIGARDQIEKQLKDRGDILDEECWLAACYLAHVVLGCIGNLFSGAKAIQNWLNLCARLISKSIPEVRIPELMAEYMETIERRRGEIPQQTREVKEEIETTEAKGTGEVKKETETAKAKGTAKAKKAKGVTTKKVGRKPTILPMDVVKKEQMASVRWTTPLGLPIVQPYRKTVRKQVMTALQTVYISDPNLIAEVNSVKQASAFPPNYIHSLDATHMTLTALECRKNKLIFASVHDSYWTHAADIDAMSEIIRETFVSLHELPILEELLKEFLQQYHNYKVPLINLTSTGLASKLHQAGSRIYATPEQAKSLTALSDLVVVTENSSTIDESRAVKDQGVVQNLLNGLGEVDAKELASDPKDKDLGIDEEGVQLGDIGESPQAKAAREKKERQKAAIVELGGKFVNLSDLFPPLPRKGEFNVSEIRMSPYFFS